MKQVYLEIPAEHEAMAEEWLWGLEAFAVASAAPHETKRTLTAQFESFDEAEFQTSLEQFCQAWDIDRAALALKISDVETDGWQTRWRESFQPLQAGRFSILPEWQEGASSNADTILIYPGQAFGTGQHETTRLVIEAMEKHNLQDARVLDVGCGTGILAIAAEKLGAATCFGFDIDPDCRENMDRHLAMNQTQNVQLEIGTLEDFDFNNCDVVLANITINVLSLVWPVVHQRMKPGALIISSGILLEQKQQALDLLAQHGYQVLYVSDLGEWCAIEAKLP